jgi:hypothetical protein
MTDKYHIEVSACEADMTRTRAETPLHSAWWRFDRYEFRNPFIQPAADARLTQYHPWQAYDDARQALRKQQGRISRPYELLIGAVDQVGGGSDLVRDIDPNVPVRFGNRSAGLITAQVLPDVETFGPLLEWCARFGLLGILLHQTRSVTLQPRLLTKKGFPPHPMQIRYNRFGGNWIQGSHEPIVAWSKEAKEGDLIPLGPQFPDPNSIAGVTDATGRRYAVETIPLAENWALFFDVPEDERATYFYPQPLTAEFWRLYREPLEGIVDAARTLKLALLESGTPQHQAGAARRLNFLLDSVTPEIRPARGRFVQRFASSSLLGTLALMAVQDLSDDAKLQECPGCKKLFVATRPKEVHCSPTCRHRMQKRNQRAEKSKNRKHRGRGRVKRRRQSPRPSA